MYIGLHVKCRLLLADCNETGIFSTDLWENAPYCHLCPAPLYNILPTLTHKRHDFREKVTEHKMCVLIFCTNLSETFLILRRTERDMIKNVYRSSCKVLVILSDFNEN